MKKADAIAALGGTVTLAARAIGVTPSAVSQWPDELPRRIEDRVLAAQARLGQVKTAQPSEAPAAATERRSTPKPEGGKPVPAPMPHEWHERGRDRRRIWNPSELLTTGEDTERRQKERRRGHAS